MTTRRPITTATKINLVLAIAFLLVLGMGVVALLSTSALVGTGREVERTYRVIALLETFNGHLMDAESAQRGYVITGDDVYLAPYHAARERIPIDFQSLRDAVTHDGQHAWLDRLRQLTDARLSHIESVIATRRDSGFEPALAMIRSGRGRVMMEEIRADIDAFEVQEFSNLDARQASARFAARRAQRVVATGSAFAGLLVLLAAVVLNRDLGRRRRMEKALRESETLLNQFLESLPAGAFVLGADGTARYANRQARTLLGIGSSDGGGDRSLPHRSRTFRAGSSERYPESEMPLARALRGETVQVDDIEVELDGVRVPLRVGAVPIYDSSGEVAYAIAVISDISLERRQRQVLSTARDAAEQANRAKSEFLARMSHELRTPLNSVIGFANILRKNKNGALVSQDLTYLERIAENGKHLLTLINDILDLSKIEAGKVELEIGPVDVRAVVEETLRQWEPVLKDGQLRIVADVPEQLQAIAADRGRIKQILTNLVSNAVKFTPAGSVTVSVDVVPGTSMPAAIHVRDTGIGIPEHRQSAVFEAFEQAETSTSRTFGGTGLGLPIARSLCELMDFRLSLASTPGTGSVFTIALNPSASVPVPAPQAAEPVASVKAPQEDSACLVLVVDDDPDTRILLTHHLEELGCRVVATPSGRNALQLARELSPDLITLDLLMDEVTGWEVLSQLKTDPRVRQIPVVIISIIAHENRAALLGSIDVLAKPVQRDVLLAAIRRNAARKQPRVLIVEDDESLRRLMARFLETEQIPSTCAGDGLEALEMLETDAPDIIVLDMGLPVLGGLDFLRRIRTDARFVGLPVVIVTGGDVHTADLAGLTGAAAVLDKGAELQSNLKETVRRILQRKLGPVA